MMDKENRYAEGISEAMKAKIISNNENDMPGPVLVEHWNLIDEKGNVTEWQKVESLSKTTKYYYNNTRTGECTTRPPDDVLRLTEKFDEHRPVNYKNPDRPKGFDNAGCQVIDVMYNSFKCSNFKSIREFNVYTYTVDFDPAIPAKGNGEKRRRVLLGPTRKDQRQRRDELYKKLGHWEFNNQVMHVLAKQKPESPLTFKCADGSTCRMCLVSHGSLDAMDDDKVRSYFLSLFTRRKLDGADYIRLAPRDGSSWFPRSHIGKTQDIGSHEYMAVLGFDVSNHYTMNNEFVMTAEMRPKCIEKRTVWDGMDFIKRKNPNNYREAIKKFYVERNVMVTYNKQRTRIDEVDFDSHENTQIPDMDDTYKTYLQKKYNVNSPKHELCVLITVDKRTGKRSGFLSQHCHVMFENEKDKSNTQDSLKNLSKEKLEQRIPRIQEFCKDISKERPRKSGKKKDWKGIDSLNFNLQCETGQAVLLPQPGIRIMYSEDRKQPGRLKTFDYIHDVARGQKIGQQWSKSKGPIKPKPMKSWTVVMSSNDKGYSVRERNGKNTIEKHILNELNGYRKGRGISTDCLPNPAFKYVDISRSKVSKRKQYLLATQKGDSVVLGILPEGDLCSQAKQEMTRAYTLCSSQRPRPTQFCQIGRFNSVKYFAKTQFDMIMLKNGNKMYELVPRLSKNSIFNPSKMWCIGIAVDVNSDHGHSPVACVTLMTDPLAGQLTATFHECHFMDFKKRIIPYEIISQMIENVVTRAYQMTGKLPDQILTFREGISEGQFPEMYSKEITAIKKTVNSTLKQKFQKQSWKPRFLFMCVQKGIIDRAGIPNRQRIQEPLQPMLCFNGPLSRKHWDFLLHIVCDKRGGSKPVKYTILNENIGLKRNATNGAIVDLFNFIHVLHYGYCESIPFQNGPSAIPSPIKYAMHNAEFIHELVRECDDSPGQLSAHKSKKLSFRPRVLDWDDEEEVQAREDGAPVKMESSYPPHAV